MFKVGDKVIIDQEKLSNARNFYVLGLSGTVIARKPNSNYEMVCLVRPDNLCPRMARHLLINPDGTVRIREANLVLNA